MSSPTRFLVLVVAGWVGFRAVTLGLLPGGEARASPTETAGLPAVAETDLRPPQFGAPATLDATAQPPAATMPPPAYWPYPAAFPAMAMRPPQASQVIRIVDSRSAPSWSMPPPREVFAGQSLAALPASPPWPEIGASVGRQSTPPLPGATAIPPRFDRVQLATWAMLRDRPGPQSLAGTGTLGGSQAGIRLLYRFTSRLALSARTTAPLGTARRGGDAALGVRYAPFSGLPFAVTLERRQGFGEMGGPSGFALLGEGGLYRQFGAYRLDSYLQAGMIVGKDGRLGFVDGAAAVTRPLWRNLEVGAGVWGGKQPGLARLDVGPRVSLKVARGIRAHADYRVKVAGNAQPGSGPVVTLAGDF